MIAFLVEKDTQCKRLQPTKRKIPLWNRDNIDNMKSYALKFENEFKEIHDGKGHTNNVWSHNKRTLGTIIEHTLKGLDHKIQPMMV